MNKYKAPTAEIVYFSAADIILASSNSCPFDDDIDADQKNPQSTSSTALNLYNSVV